MFRTIALKPVLGTNPAAFFLGPGKSRKSSWSRVETCSQEGVGPIWVGGGLLRPPSETQPPGGAGTAGLPRHAWEHSPKTPLPATVHGGETERYALNSSF